MPCYHRTMTRLWCLTLSCLVLVPPCFVFGHSLLPPKWSDQHNSKWQSDCWCVGNAFQHLSNVDWTIIGRDFVVLSIGWGHVGGVSCIVYIAEPVVVQSTWFQLQSGSTMSCQSILHVQSQSWKSDHWLSSYGVDLIADVVRATLTLRFSPNFGQHSK